MGTRSLTIVEDAQGRGIVTMYRQMDGYPSGHGQDIADFLKDICMINGFSMEQDQPGKFANGMGCLAAQIVSHFKTDVGGIYLQPTEQNDIEEDYVYIISPKSDGSASSKGNIILNMQCISYGDVLFDGPPAKFRAEKIVE